MKFLFTNLILLPKERNNFHFEQVFTVKENIGPSELVWGHIMASYQLTILFPQLLHLLIDLYRLPFKTAVMITKDISIYYSLSFMPR